MSPPNIPDLSTLPLEDLMQDLEAVRPAVSNSVENWVSTAGYYPGSTQVAASELYAKYLEYLEIDPHAGKRFDIRSWGKVMSSRFRRSRSNKQSFYYISKESDSEIRRKLR